MKIDERIVLIAGVIFLTLVLSTSTAAHHSTAPFDMTHTTTVKGTVTGYEWTNPHAYIYLDVTDDKGNIEKWTTELPALGILTRDGWRRDTLKPGDQITAVGNRAKDGRMFVRLEKIVFANGQELAANVL